MPKTPDEIKKGLEGLKFIANSGRIDDALAYIQQLEAQVPRWIPVEERLPDYDSTVLMFEQVGLFTAIAMGRLTRDEGFVTQDGFPADVTHWMPLPEPPKEKDSVR